MTSRQISAAEIRAQVIEGIEEIFCRPTGQTAELLRLALDSETDEIARDMLEAILRNREIAVSECLPLCQDTGLLIVFAELGSEVLIEGGTLEQIIGAAANEAWNKFYMRDSLAPDPLRGQASKINQMGGTGDGGIPGFPVILHLEHVPGDNLTLHFSLKGGGAENCSALKMFLPSASLDEIEEFVVGTVVEAGGKPCPPVFVGVGIGGDFESCAILAKRALLLPRESERGICEMEERILAQINRRGKGVMGFAGATTALKVSILTRPCHIASLPVAVNIDCHAHRATSRVI